MRYKIVIPKKGKNAGVAQIIGREQNDQCSQILEEISVRFGPVASVEKIDHDSDDTPVYNDANVNN